jgi:hypothetical protein
MDPNAERLAVWLYARGVRPHTHRHRHRHRHRHTHRQRERDTHTYMYIYTLGEATRKQSTSELQDKALVFRTEGLEPKS